MTGLISFAVLFAWIAVVIWIARTISRHVRTKPSVRPVVSIIAGVVIFWLPVADELTARPYFELLCHRAVVSATGQDFRGRTVRVTVSPSREPVVSLPIPITRSHFLYREVSTGAVLVEYDLFRAGGGVLSRVLPLSHGPLTGDYFCAPSTEAQIAEKYRFTVLD